MKFKFLTVTLLFINLTIIAQTFKGKVVDNAKNPIANVSIVNKKNNKHTHTNRNGQFVFKDLSLGDTIAFYHIGYKPKTVTISSFKNTPTIVLTTDAFSLKEVIITPSINALHAITDIDILTNPVNSSQDILNKVPGLFIGQHAGGGKAEQLFLRGFDIDHGTDITLSVDGLPVNMVSHAHGQGYSDLHFVIPETVNKIDFGKGSYYQDKGNFNTAGYVNFVTKEVLNQNTIKLESGQFNTNRFLGMFKLLDNNTQSAYIATEYLATDGFFESSQNFNRTNVFGKYTGTVNTTDKIGVIASYFDSKWDASGQIPQRAVDNGYISRFGAIDATEGGSTSRTNLLVSYDKFIDDNSSIKNTVFVNQYNFELFSNFTFFLEDPVNGDQIKQKENRTIFGVNSKYNKKFTVNNISGSWQAGLSLRNDKTKDTELSRTLNRQTTLEQLKLGDITETNFGAYLGTTLQVDKWTFNPSIRVDYFGFQYYDKLLTTYITQNSNAAIVSPKLNILYNPTKTLQLYVKTGKGFHSNDTRLVGTYDVDKILPAAYGFDVGYIWKPTPKMFINMAYWHLFLEQEFVYVGDAGIVEPSGKTRRQGVELSYRYQPFKWLFWNLDANYTHARAIEEIKDQNYIPLAPDFTLVSGVNVIFDNGIFGGFNIRHIDNRPANEDNSIIAKGYTVADLNLGYKLKNITFGFKIQNLFDTEWNETQFATASRLQNEANAVEEIHFTPGTPFFLNAMIQYNF